jgi:hypothetical protein
MTPTRLTLVALTAVALAGALATPSFADRNTGAFEKSNEGTKFLIGMGQVCADFFGRADQLDTKARNEAVPDKNTLEHQAARTLRGIAAAMGCKA